MIHVGTDFLTYTVIIVCNMFVIPVGTSTDLQQLRKF